MKSNSKQHNHPKRKSNEALCPKCMGRGWILTKTGKVTCPVCDGVGEL